eukprot:gene2076-2266_t
MFNSGGVLGSFNNDVLNAEPENDDAKRKLIEEIKNRAKGCLAMKNYPEAVALYSKAIEVCPGNETDLPAKAILFANRSMCRLSMNLSSAAIDDAKDAINLDPTYLKAYYRLGMAYLQADNLIEARLAFQTGLERKPDDKELKTQLDNVEKKMQAKPAASSSSTKAPTTTTTTTSTVKQPVAKSAAPDVNSSSSASSSSTTNDKMEEEDEEAKNLNLRGYKKTADGKVTTFFNHELDEHTKQLIGDIAPKKLASEQPVQSINPGEGSAWNAAGTFESKDLTSWASSVLTEKLSCLAEVIESGKLSPNLLTKLPNVASVFVETTGTEDVDGDAQVTLARGKKKHLCDYSAAVNWRLTVSFTDGGEEQSVAGQLRIIDISADGDYEFEDAQVTQYNGNKADKRSLPSGLASLLPEVVQSSSRGLKPLLQTALKSFIQELKQK